ncbi:MAG TPA: TraR/DksA family transcriptional regulator [Rhodospirillales bacterium]
MDPKAFKRRLLQMRQDIEALSHVTQEERQPVELDQSAVGRLTRMDALQNQAMQIEAERRRTIEIQRINAALARIDEGEFGYCVSCGLEIESKRLENDPTTPNCFDCADMIER